MPELGNLDDKQSAALVGLAPINCESGKSKADGALQVGKVAYDGFCIKPHYQPFGSTQS